MEKVELKQTGLRVKLIGEDGNAFNLLGIVRAALRCGGYGDEFIDAVMKEAMSDTYDHLLYTLSEVVEIY